MANLTSSEIAGFGVGAFLLCATIAAPKIDAFISASQRRSLGMCRICGDLKVIACPKCKGTGLIRSDGLFGLNFMDDLSNKAESVPCKNCQAKGNFSCPQCSNVSKA